MASKTQRTEHTHMVGVHRVLPSIDISFLVPFFILEEATLLSCYYRTYGENHFSLSSSIVCMSSSLLDLSFATVSRLHVYFVRRLCYSVNGKWVAWFHSSLRIKLPFVSFSKFPACLTSTKCFVFCSLQISIYLVCVLPK